MGLEFVERLHGGTAAVFLSNDDGARLTPEQAEEMAAQLLEAARRVREFEASRA